LASPLEAASQAAVQQNLVAVASLEVVGLGVVEKQGPAKLQRQPYHQQLWQVVASQEVHMAAPPCTNLRHIASASASASAAAAALLAAKGHLQAYSGAA